MASESTCKDRPEPPNCQYVDCHSNDDDDNWGRARRILLEWVEDRTIQGQWEKRDREDVGLEDAASTTFLQLALQCANNGAQLEQVATTKHDEHVEDGTSVHKKIKSVYGANASVAAVKRRRRNELLTTVELKHNLYEELYEKYRAERNREAEQAEHLVKVWISCHHRQPQSKVEERLTKVIPIRVLVNVCNCHGDHDNH